MPSADSRPLRLGWGSFALVAIMTVVIFGLLTFLPGEATRSTRLPMWFFCFSLLGFFAFRWHSLRKVVFSGQLSPSEFRKDPRRHLLGPRLPLVVWFVMTIAILLSFVIVQALTWK
jgi:hypothetical protein